MPRLVTFGCSYTYGIGLPDIYPIDKTNQRPSKFSWAQLLADKLEYTCENLSKAGSGNKEIFSNILSSIFYADDLVIAAWTHFERYNFFDFTKGITGTRISTDTAIGKEKILQQKISNKNWMLDLVTQNYLTIQHADLYLKDLGIKAYHFIISGDNYKYPVPDYIRVRKFLSISNKDYVIDKGLDITYPKVEGIDTRHPGTGSNELLSKLLYDKITV